MSSSPHTSDPSTIAQSRGAATSAGCRICGAGDVTVQTAQERMFGTGESFRYVQCGTCGCLQIAEVPSDLSPYYPEGYYSLQASLDLKDAPRTGWRSLLRRQRNAWQMFPRRTPWHRWAAHRSSSRVRNVQEWYRECPIPSLDVRVLDVGCGSGQRLATMYQLGFRELVGIDPYLRPHASLPQGLQLHATTLDRLEAAPFDIIMMHHSLEHMDQHAAVFRHVARLLKPHGACLVRIPVATSDLLASHGDAWVEWDPPRHLYLHTPESLRTVVEPAGLSIARTFFDATAFCYWASELYRQNLSLMDPKTKRFRVPEQHFTPDELARFASQADEANLHGTASRAGFWIQHRT